ncbi:MAG: putative lipid II flippase FtsW [Deltaproteobacteria bacterium]|nr:putative lipid II flippase FtsW [Deltaproteobacteria bacterium]
MLKRADSALPTRCDQILLVSSLILVSLGLTMVFVSSTFLAQHQYQDPYFFFRRQALYALVGVGILYLGRHIPYQSYQRYVYLFMVLTLIGLILVFIPPLGAKVRGAARWVRLGPISLQPSEFAKLAMVLFLAYSMTRKQEKMKDLTIGFLPHILVAGLFVGLIGLESDFGTALTLAAIVFIMLLVGGARLTYLGITAGLGAVAVTVMVLKDPKKLARFFSFLDPWKYGQDAGYQLKQSLLAIGSGGATGLGPGQSRAKLFYLPDAHTDFILSIFSEELGFVGVFLILALFAILIYRGILLSLRAPDTFGSYLALGLTLVIGLQAVINMAVVSGMAPTKGLSLPFLSYGGSSLLVNLMSVGILLNISSQIKKPGAPAASPPKAAEAAGKPS